MLNSCSSNGGETTASGNTGCGCGQLRVLFWVVVTSKFLVILCFKMRKNSQILASNVIQRVEATLDLLPRGMPAVHVVGFLCHFVGKLAGVGRLQSLESVK